MPLTRSKRNNTEHLYFTKGSKKIYLGTGDKPKEDRLEEALRYLEKKIKKYEGEFAELEGLMSIGSHDVQLKYKLVVFDLDGVVFEKPWHVATSEKVAISTWDLVFKEVGFYKVHETYRKQFEDGIFPSYMEWTEEACKFLKSIGLKRDTFEEILRQREFTLGGPETLQVLAAKGVVTGIVSGSFTQLAQRVREKVHVDAVMAHCDLHFDKKGILDSWKLHPVDYQDKARFVRELAKKRHIDINQCAYVGDDVNDLDAFKEVGLSIAFNAAKPQVRQNADHTVDSRDLRSILPLLYDQCDVTVPA